VRSYLELNAVLPQVCRVALVRLPHRAKLLLQVRRTAFVRYSPALVRDRRLAAPVFLVPAVVVFTPVVVLP